MDASRLATSLWERLYREYNDASLLPDRAEAHRRREEADRSPHRLIGRAYREEHGWAYQALRDPDRKWFAVRAFTATVPRRFFAATLRAAVQETEYARTNEFVLPCMYSYGARRVTEELLHYLRSGTAAQQAGAAVALVSTAMNALDWQSYCYTGRVSERITVDQSSEIAARGSYGSIALWCALLVVAIAEIGYRHTLFPLQTALLSLPRQAARVQHMLSIAVH